LKTRKYNHHYRLELKIRKKTIALFIAGFILGLALFCLLVFVNWAGFGKRAITLPTEEGIVPTSVPVKETRKRLDNTSYASYYCEGFEGNTTASGSIYHCDDLTFAHKTMKFGTKVKFLRDEGNGGGRVVTATCTDRGPFIVGRDFDFSSAVFKRLGNLSEGVIEVRWEVVE